MEEVTVDDDEKQSIERRLQSHTAVDTQDSWAQQMQIFEDIRAVFFLADGTLSAGWEMLSKNPQKKKKPENGRHLPIGRALTCWTILSRNNAED